MKTIQINVKQRIRSILVLLNKLFWWASRTSSKLCLPALWKFNTRVRHAWSCRALVSACGWILENKKVTTIQIALVRQSILAFTATTVWFKVTDIVKYWPFKGHNNEVLKPHCHKFNLDWDKKKLFIWQGVFEVTRYLQSTDIKLPGEAR